MCCLADSSVYLLILALSCYSTEVVPDVVPKLVPKPYTSIELGPWVAARDGHVQGSLVATIPDVDRHPP